jgi:type II secretory ATPase GspE/PulE/Tfp pilus assembly ATPase PilB-like protein
MTWSDLTQDVERLFSTCQGFQISKMENNRKKYGLLPHKIAESDTLYLVHGMCGSGGTTSIYNKDTSQNTLSACTHHDRSSHWLVLNFRSHK